MLYIRLSIFSATLFAFQTAGEKHSLHSRTVLKKAKYLQFSGNISCTRSGQTPIKDIKMASKQDLSNFTKGEPEAEVTKLPTLQSVVGEPMPEWYSAVPTWGIAWDFYQYGIGATFAIVMISTATILLRTLQHRAARPKKASLVVLILLFIFGLSRCLYLSVDAYNTKRILPEAFLNVLWSLGNPCIITAYTLFFLVLKNTFVLRERFQTWYTARKIAFITVPYFLLVLVADLVLFYLPSFEGLTFVCQMIYVTLSLMLSFFYSFVAYLLRKNYRGAKVHRRKESGSKSIAWTATNRVRGRRTRSMLKTCIAVVIGGAILCALQVYSMSSVYGVFSNAPYVPAWPWLILNYAMRVLELLLSLVLFVVSARGIVNQQRSFRGSVSFEGSLNTRRRSRLISLPTNTVSDAGHLRLGSTRV